MTPAWKASVDAALVARDWTRTQLATACGVHKTVISAMLSERQVASDAVELVSNVLGIPMPVLGVDDEIAMNLAKLTAEDKRTVLDLIRRLSK